MYWFDSLPKTEQRELMEVLWWKHSIPAIETIQEPVIDNVKSCLDLAFDNEPFRVNSWSQK